MTAVIRILRAPGSGAFRALLAVAVVGLAAVGGRASGRPLMPDEVAQVERVVRDALAKSGAPSASVAIVRDGEIAFAMAYGLRGIDPPVEATAATRYRIASVSKQFTAAAILILADDGKLSLDDEVAKYLPELSGPNHVTLRQALSHTAGYPDFWSLDFLPPALKRPMAPSAIATSWGTRPVEFKPGTSWAYSNTGYVILARIVERVSGQSLDAFLKARIFTRLRMDSAADVDGRPPAAFDAVGYARAALGPDRPAALPASGWTSGAGELSMTPSDLARWDVGVINRSVMSPAAHKALETEVKLADGAGTGYGLGVWVDSVGAHRRIRHHGDLPGFWTENRIFPDDRAAIVVALNASYGASPHIVIANGIERLLFPDTIAPPSDYAVARRLYDQIGTGTLDRSLLTADANDALSGTVLSDYQATFAKYGQPLAFITLRNNPVGDSTWTQWMAVLPAGNLGIVMRRAKDGKVEEFLASPLD